MWITERKARHWFVIGSLVSLGLFCAIAALDRPFEKLWFAGAMASWRAIEKAIDEEAPGRRLAQIREHGGTLLHPHRSATGAALSRQKAICEWFALNDPRPLERVAFFDVLIRSNRYRIQGWSGRIQSIKPARNGSTVEIAVRPYLRSLRGGVPFSPASCTETWHAGPDGRLTFQSARLSEQPMIFMTD
jgi:hypothetical protein